MKWGKRGKSGEKGKGGKYNEKGKTVKGKLEKGKKGN